MVFCGKCGTKNPDDNLYCRQCGARLQTEEKPPYEPPKVSTGPTGPIVVDEMTPSELKRDPSSPSGYVVVPVDKERVSSYRIPILIMGFVMCAIVLALVFVVEIPYDIYGVKSGYQITTESYTLWEMLNEGFSSTLSLCIVAVIIFALLSMYNYSFSLLALVILELTVVASSAMLQDVEMGYIQVKMFLADDFMVTFAVAILGGMAAILIPGYLDHQFSKMYPLKGAIFRMSRVWKL